MPHRLHLEQIGPVHALPVLHYKMEFAHLVRDAVAWLEPDCICIELPPTLRSAFLRGIGRLPEISVLSYETKPGSKTEAAQNVYFIMEPADPLVEAARLAVEQDIPLELIDVDLDDYPLHAEPLPDSYAVQRLGLKAYYDEFVKATSATHPGKADLHRERGMAFQLQALSAKHERILFVCGMYHLERIKTFFDHPQGEPLARVRRENVRLFNLHPDSCREILAEYPFLSAIYEMRRGERAIDDNEEFVLELNLYAGETLAAPASIQHRAS